MQDVNIFEELFMRVDMWGYLGPLALVVIGYYIGQKDKFIAVLWFVVECLFVANYLALIDATPGYWWHIFILLLGGLFTLIYPMFDR